MKQHAAWRHPEVDMPGGIFRGPPGLLAAGRSNQVIARELSLIP